MLENESSTVVMGTERSTMPTLQFSYVAFFLCLFVVVVVGFHTQKTKKKTLQGHHGEHFAFPQKFMICFVFLISRYDATPSLRAFSLEPPSPTPRPSLFTLERCVNPLIAPSLPPRPPPLLSCALSWPWMSCYLQWSAFSKLSTVKYLSVFFFLNACSLQCSPSVRVLLPLEKGAGEGPVVMYNGRTEVSLQVDGISSVRSSSGPLSALKVLLKSARSGADSFFFSFSATHNDTSKRDLSCHAKISVKVPLSSLLAPAG